MALAETTELAAISERFFEVDLELSRFGKKQVMTNRILSLFLLAITRFQLDPLGRSSDSYKEESETRPIKINLLPRRSHS